MDRNLQQGRRDDRCVAFVVIRNFESFTKLSVSYKKFMDVENFRISFWSLLTEEDRRTAPGFTDKKSAYQGR